MNYGILPILSIDRLSRNEVVNVARKVILITFTTITSFANVDLDRKGLLTNLHVCYTTDGHA